MRQLIDIEDLLIWAYRDQKVETNAAAHDDARSVHWAVSALPAMYGALVRHFARAGVAPAWSTPSDRVVVLEDARRARTLYREWVRTLAILRNSLEDALEGYQVCGPAAGDHPWPSRRTA